MEKKYKIWIWILLSVIIALIVAFITLYARTQRISTYSTPIERPLGQGRGMVIQYLQLDENQINQYDQIRHQYNAQIASIRDSMLYIRKTMIQELKSDTPDTLKLNFLATEVGRLEGRINIVMNHHLLKLKQICRPNQCILLDSLYERMLNTSKLHQGMKGGKGYRHRRNPYN